MGKSLQANGLIGAEFILPKLFPDLSKREHRYEKFVKQIEMENPGSKLTKELVDKAAETTIYKQFCKSKEPHDSARVKKLVKQVSVLHVESTRPRLLILADGAKDCR